MLVNDRLTTISVSKEKIDELEGLLANFSAQSNTNWALLISGTGHLVIQRGFVYSFDVLSISALACGVFNSTQELARLVGEKRFKEFLQEGKAISLYYISVSEEAMDKIGKAAQAKAGDFMKTKKDAPAEEKPEVKK